jgi:hypothetical protein
MQSCNWMAAGILTSCVCFGQTVSVGVIGGVRATDDLTGGGATSVSKRYAVGPSLEVGLPFGLAIEADALYRRTGFQVSASSGSYYIFGDERANLWEVPILLKYRIPLTAARPFLEAGYVSRVIGGSVSRNTAQNLPEGVVTYSSYDSTWSNSNGLVVGGGVQFALGRLHLSPVVRYTYWNDSTVAGGSGGPGAYFYAPAWRSNQNQVDVLLGVAWKVR